MDLVDFIALLVKLAVAAGVTPQTAEKQVINRIYRGTIIMMAGLVVRKAEERKFMVYSESYPAAYDVDLSLPTGHPGRCNCLDAQRQDKSGRRKQHWVCKHQIAAYISEQAQPLETAQSWMGGIYEGATPEQPE